MRLERFGRSFLLAIALAAPACGRGGKSWGEAERIGSGGDVESFQSPEVAVDSDGDAVAVWHRSSAGGGGAVRANRFSRGSGWAGEEAIGSGDPDGFATLPEVALDPRGRAFVAWQEEEGDGLHSATWVRQLPVGSGGGTLTRLFRGGLVGPNAAIAADPDGNALAVFVAFDGASPQLLSSRFEEGKSWGAAQIVGLAGAPIRVRTDATGNAVAAWVLQTDGARSVWANRFTVGQGWGAPEVVGSDGFDPVLAVDPEGNGLVVFRRAGDRRFSIWASRLDADRGWERPQRLAAEDFRNDAPDVAVAEDGRGLAVWGGAGVSYSRFTPENGWSAADLVPGSRDATAVRVAMRAKGDGEAVAVWEQLDTGGTVSEIHAGRFTEEKGWEEPVRIQKAPPPVREGLRPRIAIDRDGNAIAVWIHGQGADAVEIWANRFGPEK